MSRKLVVRAILAIAVLILIFQFFSSQPEITPVHVEGQTMGSIKYNVKYIDEGASDYKKEIDSILIALNASLSTYIEDSEISELNRTKQIFNPSEMFLNVIRKSEDIWLSTFGAFDPTVGPLVNAWGFGPDGLPNSMDSTSVDSLLLYVGFGKMLYDPQRIGMEPGMYLDFSAIAKGYAVDLIAEFLEENSIEDYMVEIGGEVRAKGGNGKANTWSIGIEDPLVKSNERKLLAVAKLNNLAMATSGNYRNYYEKEGKVIAHTIDPRTGFSAQNEVLSASVFAKECVTADAYATAMMVMGLEASKVVIGQNNIEAVIIYSDSEEIGAYVSEGIASSIEFLEEINQSLSIQ